MIAFFCLFCFLVLQSESSNVSPKLDFESTDQVAPSDGISPKIQGVRVIVDTTNVKKSIESRSSEEETRLLTNKKDKKIGIRTDITFEISDDEKNSTGGTEKHKDSETSDEDVIIPVFKGYGGIHEPKSYGDNRRWDMINIPVFHGTDDESTRNGGGDWVRFVPITSVWTTERNNYLSNRDSQRRFKPDINPLVSQKTWKPCLCASDQVGFKSDGRRSFVPTTKKVVRIDDKLARTFPDEDKSKK